MLRLKRKGIQRQYTGRYAIPFRFGFSARKTAQHLFRPGGMWVRLRIDISWLRCLFGFMAIVIPFSRRQVKKKALQEWSHFGVHDQRSLFTLSLRSAFDLFLRAIDLPRGSGVLMSSITISDMVRIVEEHGLIAIPVDCKADGSMHLAAFQAAYQPHCRMVVMAHLFGAHQDISPLRNWAQSHNMLVVEDCAQSFCGWKRRHNGCKESDLMLYSFGLIKTATAGSGGVATLRSASHFEKMEAILDGDTIQTRKNFLQRLCRLALLKLGSGRFFGGVIYDYCRFFGKNPDAILGNSARGFQAKCNSEEFFRQLRQQPSTPLLWLLGHRWRQQQTQASARKMISGRHLCRRLGHQPAYAHCYWLFAMQSAAPSQLIRMLRYEGFDATKVTRLNAFAEYADHALPHARAIMQELVLVPLYPAMPIVTQRRLACILATFHPCPRILHTRCSREMERIAMA